MGRPGSGPSDAGRDRSRRDASPAPRRPRAVEREAGRSRWDLAKVREGLILGTPGAEFRIGDLSLRVGDVPLFRRDASGGLRQAVRLWLRADGAPRDVTFSLLDGETVLDRTTVPVAAVAASAYLLVPEVRQPTTVTLEVAPGAGEPFRAPIEVAPQRKWSVFLVHHSHLDIGYTDPQALVLRQQLAYLDAALDLAAATDDWPEPARFRWNVEVTWPLRHWLAARPASAREALFERVRQGRIEVNALPFTMHSEAYSIDELAWGLRFADELRERHGLPIVSAMQTDVPGHTIGLLNLLIAAGVRYLAVAHNYAGRSAPFLTGGQELSRPFWWEAADGRRLLVWYTDTPHGVAYMEGNLVGLASDYETARAGLPEYLNALAHRPYPYDPSIPWLNIPPDFELTRHPYPHDLLHLRVQSVIADNAAPSLAPAEIVRRWNEEWAWPRLRMATNREFFEAVEERLGDRLATERGDWTDWWVDGIGSGARPLGFARRAQATIRVAQTLHVVADTLAGAPDPAVPAEVDRVYDDLALFDEHTWGAANPWDDGLEAMESGGIQWARKAAFAHDAHDRADALLDAAVHRLAPVVGTASAALASVAVVNPSSWGRTDVVRVFVPESRVGQGQALRVVDAATGEAIPHATEPPEHAPFRARGRFLAFTARDVPPLGYARYDLVADDATGGIAADASPSPEAATLENDHYRLAFDTAEGRLARLVDKAADRELVDPTALHGFGQYVYDRYTTAPGFNHLSSRVRALHDADLTLLGSRSVGRYGVVTRREATPVWDRLTVRLVGEGVDRIETTLTLPRDVKRLEIANRIWKVATLRKESVFFAFPFALDAPAIEYAITGGVHGPDAPRLPGSSEHMRAVRHWITLATGEARVAWATLEAPLVQVGNIHLPYMPFPPTIDPALVSPATIYSWALNNIWDTNFPPQQGGELRFRYAVASADGDGVGTRELGLRTAAALTAPLLGVVGALGPGGNLPARGSFCAVDQPEVEVVALAPSRREHDLVLFLHSHASDAVEARVAFGLLPVARAWTGTFLERQLAEMPIEGNAARVRLAPGDYVSLSVDLVGAGSVDGARRG